MKPFLIGGYAGVAVATFVFIGFFVVIGGRGEEVWKPFVYALFWPIAILLFLHGFFSK